MMAMVMPQLLVMALVLHRMLTMINMPRERVPRLCKMLQKVKTRNIVLMPRTKLMRCEEGQCV
jgi:hypothetical protein